MRHLTYIFIFLLLLLLVSACRTVRTTQAEYVYIHDSDTVQSEIVRLDSVVIHDSVVTMVKGDSVFIERWHKESRVKTDTRLLKMIVTQKLYYTKEKEVEKEVNRLYWWQKVLMWMGGIALVSFLVWLAVRLIILYRSR